MASTTDKFSRVSDSDTGRPVIAQLAAGKSIGATSISINGATNWTTLTKIHFTIYNTMVVSGKTIKDTTTQTEWTGTVAGTTISNLALSGGTDQTYLAGAYVELTPTDKYAKDLYDGLAVLHNPDGSFKAAAVGATAVLADSIVTTAKIADGAITTAKLVDGNVTLAKLAIGATRLGINRYSANGLVPASYTTFATVTATSTGKECEAYFSAIFTNANSGQNRSVMGKVQCDGVDVTPADIPLDLVNLGITSSSCLSFVVSSTPSAGSHTWTFQAIASAASAVGLKLAVLKVSEIV